MASPRDETAGHVSSTVKEAWMDLNVDVDSRDLSNSPKFVVRKIDLNPSSDSEDLLFPRMEEAPQPEPYLDSVDSGDTSNTEEPQSPGPSASTPIPITIVASPVLNGDRGNGDEGEDPQPKMRSVRFRSRVRITSGVHRHRSRPSTSTGLGGLSMESSLSSSPSSSISAPLRSPQEDSQSSWGPLGRRVSMLKRGIGGGGGGTVKRAQIPPQWRPYDDSDQWVNERTPLVVGRRRRRSYHEQEEDGGIGDGDNDVEVDSEQARLNREIDAIFGRWPMRLLNRHWWWWQIEPIICCGCLDEDDTDVEE